MKIFSRVRRLLVLLLALALISAATLVPRSFNARAQSRRQPPTSPQKKNQRPAEGEQKQGEPQPPEQVPQDVLKEEAETLKVQTALVNVETVVYSKKTKQIVTGLKQKNFAILVDGAPKDITNFSTPEAPITVAVILEYSKLAEYLRGNQFEWGIDEVIRPAAMFLTQVIRPPDDYVSVVAYDMRPTPLTDFTNDPARLNAVINLLLRNRPVSSEANLFDALKLVLVGGKGDSVVLENSEKEKTEYAGLASLQGRRKAIFLVCSGIDTFSKINYDQARKIAQNAGVPIYIIGTGNLFMKKYGDMMTPDDGLLGATTPGRMTMLQAQNALNTFAKETGGIHIPVTQQGEIPSALQTINALMRNQYSIGFRPNDARDGKQHKITVKVDVNGDGTYDDKEYELKYRPFYNAPKG